MRLNAIALLVGMCVILFLPVLPSQQSLLLIFLTLSLVSILLTQGRLKRSKPKNQYLLKIVLYICLACLSFSYSVWTAQQRLSWQLPESLENQIMPVQGTIVSIPELKNDHFNFVFRIEQFPIKLAPVLVNLNWYSPPPNVRVGQSWQVTVKLRKIHGFANPGGFDEEANMLQKNIGATGYVTGKNNQLLATTKNYYFLDSLRQVIAQHIVTDLPNSPYAAMIQALTVGVKSGISSDQWQVMQRTGTNHLMVIAGLHIGLLSGLAFLIMNFVWRRHSQLPLIVPTPLVAALAALIMALIYSALAGFSIPTQRALIMLSVFLVATLWRRNLLLGLGIALALILVIVLQPLALFDAGFWLSFAAVTVILYGMGARLFPQNKWRTLLRLQFVVGLGLIPFTLLFFQNGSLIAPLANAIAIPIVGLVVVPLSLTGALFSFIWPSIANVMWHAAALLLEGVWWILVHLGEIPFLVWQQAIYSWWSLMAGICGWLLLFAPRGIPNRWLGVLWILPLIFTKPFAPIENSFKFTLLDVGQGLASVVQTAHHVLVFDTGAKFGADFDLGAAVVVPFLRHDGISKIDMLVISHGDNDHIGGAQSVLKNFPVKQIFTSVPQRFAPLVANECLAGQQWQWDGVQFKFLYPVPSMLGLDNNSSCVLRISVGNEHLLLTGDIEKPAEEVLVKTAANDLPAQILVAPHHGSKTSSTPLFAQAVHPKFVLYPVGYLNKYHFPSASVLMRYEQLGAHDFASNQCGAISLLISSDKISIPDCYRESHSKWWWSQ
jgi:competence protein ComEC